MGYKSTSTRRTSAASAVSSQTVVVNTATGFAAVGATIKSNTAISLGVTTAGQTSAATTTTISAGPVIGNVQYLDANNVPYSDDIAVSTAGGNILINGTGFVTGSNIYVNNSLVSNTFISSTQILAILPAASSGNINLMIFTPTNVGTIGTNIIRYSGFPTWTTAAIQVTGGTASNVVLSASGDSTLTYTLQAGSTLPTGLSLNSSGYISGTPTGYLSTTSVSVVLVVTDAEGQATQQSVAITVAVNDAYFKYTTLLLNGDTISVPFKMDSSTNALNLTIAGDTKSSLFSPYQGDGYYGINFASQATENSVTTSGSNVNLGAGDFTVEGWFNATALADGRAAFVIGTTGTASLYLISSGTTNWQIGTYQATIWSLTASMTTYPAIGMWSHHAIVRSSGTIKWYINGVQVGTVSNSTSYTGTGASVGYWSSTGGWLGYISNFRVVVGTAVYTAAFTPPTTPLTAIAGTQLLIAQSNRFVDKSTNNYTLTVAGSPQISPAIPFTASSSYSTYGSALFPTDTGADYLRLPASVSGLSFNADFTLEFWVYVTGAEVRQFFGSTTNGKCRLYVNAGYLQIYNNSGTINLNAATAFTSSLLNQWVHIAISRTGSNLYFFVNGVSKTITVSAGAVTDTLDFDNQSYIGTYSTIKGFQGYMADFRAVKGTGVYTANFTPPTTPLTAIANTSLLTLQYNGGVNNYNIIDKSNFNTGITRAGNARQGTFSPYSQTGWSNYFNGSSTYITSASSSNNALGSGDFTIEFWCLSDGLGSGSAGSPFYVNNAGGYQQLIRHNGPNWECYYKSGTAFVSVSTSTIPLNQWTHHAMVRSSGTIKWYINGVQYGTASDATNYTSATNFVMGNYGGYIYHGYVSNARVVVGTAVYTTAFTPPIEPLTAISGTVFLSAQSNRFIDNSSLNNALTVTSTPSVQAFSPFTPSAAYTPSLHGGSVYLDGSGDSLTIPAGATGQFGTKPFTIEFWMYGTDAATSIIFQDNASVPNWSIIIVSGSLYWQNGYAASSLYYIGLASLTTNPLRDAWTHVAITRNSSNLLKWWINGVGQTSYPDDTNDYSSTSAIKIGSGAYGDHTGYLSDIRITKGTAVYTANFTPPTAPLTPLAGTNLLLNFTDGGIVDAHSSYNLDTVGGIQLNTSVKKYGNASLSFSGTSQYLTIPSTKLLNFGSGDFTVEAWVYPNSLASDWFIISSSGSDGLFVGFSSTSTVGFGWGRTGTAWDYRVAATATSGTWQHVAVTRNGTSMRLFINGSQQGTTQTISTDYDLSITSTTVGSQGANYYLNGYLDDLRVTKGFARYTANFTPPTVAMLAQ